MNVQPFPVTLRNVLHQLPNISLRIENFSLPLTEPEKILEAVPTHNLVSLELATDDYEISRPIRDFVVSAKNLETLRLTDRYGAGRYGIRFGSDGDKLPPIKDLYLEGYVWRSWRDSPKVWCFSDLKYITMDDVSLVDFLGAVADIPFPHLRRLVLRDPSSSPDRVPHILSGLYTLVLSATHLKELDVWYRSKSHFYGPKARTHGTTLEPLTRLHVLRGPEGISNILEAILAA